MVLSVPGRALHGGVGRVVALAARSLGYSSAIAALHVDDELRVITRVGDDASRLLESARLLSEGGRVELPDVLGVPLRHQGGTPVGGLCLAGGPPDRDVAADALVLADFATVLQDQLDLLLLLGAPPDPGAVERLREGIALGQVRAWFQPIVRLDDESLVGFEALARWRTGAGEVAGPGEFVPLAEQAGLVTLLDLAVLRSAVAEQATWQRTHPDLRLSVNLSGRHLDDPGWLDQVHDIVVAAGVPPHTVELELTESARPADVLRSVEALQRARSLGYEVWFDDFGTGWSELRHLVELPVDGVKVDRFFTEARGNRGDSVVRAVVQLARDLGLGTVIEGVSERAHAERAVALGCDLGQGFLWSPAVPPEEVAAVLASRSSRFSAADR